MTEDQTPVEKKPETEIKAHQLAKKHKEISVAEFFERNKHILGFGNPTRALVTGVKEGVDNALDACEESDILPDLLVQIKTHSEEECRLIIEDNGPGIIKKQIPHIFGRLLYGSRFHAIRQSRGQQGIGISSVVLYGQLTTGKSTRISSKISEDQPASVVHLNINTNKNRAEVSNRETEEWEKPTGTRIEVDMIGDYKRARKYVYEYLQSISIVNPHARITFIEPDKTTHLFERTTEKLPRKAEEIKPHPYGVELGTLLKMGKNSSYRKLSAFLKSEFSSMGSRTTAAVLESAGLDAALNPKRMSREHYFELHKAFKKVKIMSPPTDCLSPIGETLIKRSLKHETQEISPEFIVTSSRPPAVYSGSPFQIEVGIVYGGALPRDTGIRMMRFANRVPLLYQQGGCVSTKAISSIDWRRYGFTQPSGKGVPVGPAIFLTHISSTQVPFTSESKEAIADIPEIENEIKLAFRGCARKVQSHIKKKQRRAKTREKFELITKILPEIARKSSSMIEKPQPSLEGVITKIMDVVWIEDEVSYEKMANPPKSQEQHSQLTLFETDQQPISPWLTKSSITVTNYKAKPQRFTLYALVPEDAEIQNIQPQPTAQSKQFLAWKLPEIQPTEKITLNFELLGLEKNDFDNDLYIEGINAAFVIGADKWEGE